MNLTHLKVERSVAPFIDEPRPRFSWRIESDRPGIRQIAYRIVVTRGLTVLWDSEKVESDRQSEIDYAGTPFSSRDQLRWTVTAWDELGQSATADSRFEVTIGESDWQAEWIGGPLAGGRLTSAPTPAFRTQFAGKEVVSARLYTTAAGVYIGYLNGLRIGDLELAPGWTDYRKHLRFQTYDVTALIQDGSNELRILVGDGWWTGHVEWRGRHFYGDRPLLKAQLEINFADGTREIIATNPDWEVAYGPFLQSDLLMGEHFDARLDFTDWQPSEIHEGPTGKLIAQAGPPMRVTEDIKPISDVKKGGWQGAIHMFDLGQNMVGRVRIKVKGVPGATIRIRHAEVLDKLNEGNLYVANLRSAQQTDTYTLRGDADGEVWEPLFTFHGFRHVEIMDFTGGVEVLELTGRVIHSDYELTGDFECSDPLINQLFRNIRWGWRGNSLDVPTDCPQRDERLGWTGDAQVFVRASTYLADVATFWEKYQMDLGDAQTDQGSIPPTVPDTACIKEGDGGPAWADAVVICPWTIYQAYGDRRILETAWPQIKAFIGFLEATEIDGIRCHPKYERFQGFLDWLNINAETPADVIGTAFYAHVADLASRVAVVLGDDPTPYRALFERIRKAFNDRFVSSEGLVHPGTQTAYLLALHFNLLSPELQPKAVDRLVYDIRRRGTKLSTGFVGSPYLNHVLTNHGREDVAFDLLKQPQWPSWLYAVTQGATTIWERWDGWTHDKGFQDVGMNSFNHYAYGAIGDWIMQRIAGIDHDPKIPGYRRLLMRPLVGGGITSVKASYQSDYGLVRSEWSVKDGQFDWQITVPPNSYATAILTDGTARELGAGHHHLSSPLPV